VFITQGIGRYEQQFDPERTYWQAIEIHPGTRVHLARTVACGDDPPRLIMICTSQALFNAIVKGSFGQVEQLWSLGRIRDVDPLQWGSQRVVNVLHDYMDILGGMDRLEVLLEDGERYCVNPAISTFSRHPPKIIWESLSLR